EARQGLLLPVTVDRLQDQCDGFLADGKGGAERTDDGGRVLSGEIRREVKGEEKREWVVRQTELCPSVFAAWGGIDGNPNLTNGLRRGCRNRRADEVGCD